MVNKEQRKRDKERKKSMEKMIIQLKLFTKHVMGTRAKEVNVEASKFYEDGEEAKKIR